MTFFISFLCKSLGKSNSAKDNVNDRNNNIKNEILDLGDLDLSQLRLTKKDLETLSSITPNLSRNIQEQLLAQLPPNQAKKLSRTLSIQNQSSSSSSSSTRKSPETTQIYRRSMSSNAQSVTDRHSRDSVTPTNEVFDNINNNIIRNSSHHRRSASQEDKLNDDSINNNCIYRERTLSPELRNYSQRATSPSEDIERACFSPPPLIEKKISKRFSNKSVPIYDEPKKIELATHKILREMREKSQEKSNEMENGEHKTSYYSNKYTYEQNDKHLHNKNLTASVNSPQPCVASSINNKILDELNSISLLNNQLERFDQLEIQSKEKVTKKKISSSTTKSEETQLIKSTKIARERSKEKTIDSIEKTKSVETKLMRPKSFISHDVVLKPCVSKESEKVILESNSKLERPKSFPNSKITPPMELKKLPDIILEQNGKINEDQKDVTAHESSNINQMNSEVETKKAKKVVKVVKKSAKKIASTTSTAECENQQSAELEIRKEKSPEKKNVGKGLLYTIGQKFEKLRDTKTKKSDEIREEKKSETIPIDMKEKKKKIKAMLNEDVDEITRQERKTKIDALIRNLKDKSVPHSNLELTESGLIKRAVSVEEMPNTFNKNTVNKVLGLFKKIEKENGNKSSRVQNTKSTSFLSSMEATSASSSLECCSSSNLNNNSVAKERPKSSGFVNKIKNNGATFEPLANISESKIPVKFSCSECQTNPTSESSLPPSVSQPQSSTTQATIVVTKRHFNEEKQSFEEKERLKNNRKGLMLDFSRFKSPEPDIKEIKKTNYSFPPPLPDDNHKSGTPTYDNLTNYSSAAFDVSVSSSLSPSEDVGNDGWSTSDDHHAVAQHPLGSLSLSRLSRRESNMYVDDAESPESVIDRIRRKSFYSRFNEKKTKRVSSIVGPAAKDYYRERSKPLEYTRSATTVIPDIMSSSSTRASSVDSTTIPHHIRASSISRYTSPTSSTAATRSLSQSRTSSKYSTNDNVNDAINHSNSFRRINTESNHLTALPPPYHVHHHSHHHHELSLKDDISAKIKMKSNRNTMYDSSSSSSNTPSSLSSLYAKRRSFVSSSPSTTTTSSAHYSSSSSMTKPPHSFIDGYATIGRKTRQYNTRSVSLLDPNIINSSNSYSSDHYRLNGNMESNLNSARFVPLSIKY